MSRQQSQPVLVDTSEEEDDPVLEVALHLSRDDRPKPVECDHEEFIPPSPL